MNKQIKNSLLLLLTATIWGTAFVAQSAGMDHIGPITFNGFRTLIGAAVLFPIILVMNFFEKRNKQNIDHGNLETINLTEDAQTIKKSRIELIKGGVICGVVLFVATTSQQFGIKSTSVGKAGFITAFYIVLVPILGLFIKKRCSIIVYFSVVLALIGLAIMCIDFSDLSLLPGDLLLMFSALMFSVHILIIDHYSPKVEGIKLSCLQFLVCGMVSIIPMLIFEDVQMSALIEGWFPLVYAGAFSSGVAYTLQIIGQRDMNPTIASLILSLESVISVIAGWLLLGQILSGREVLGCIIIFIAIILTQLPVKKKDIA